MSIIAHHLRINGRIGFVQEAVPHAPTGTTLVLIHTAGQSGVQWRDVLKPLTGLGYRLLVPDLPGHGHSEPAARGAVQDLSEYAEWILALVDTLEVSHPVLVGCSIGGKIVLDLAVHRPADLAAAVSMCAEAGPGKGKLHALRRELEDSAAPARADRTHLGTRAVLGRNVDEDRATLIARMHCREDPQVSTSDLIGWGTHDLRSRLADITCPITFVAGQDDPWVDPAAVAAAAEQVAAGRYKFLQGYGHYPMEEMADFADILHGWISEMIGVAAP